MKLVIEHSALGDLSVQTNLFKMQTDQLSFEEFEELFDDDDEVDLPEEPLFESEWRRSKNFCLHTDQPAVFIAVADVVHFIETSSRPTRFFIHHEIKTEIMTARLIMDAGCIDIDYRMLSGTESEISKSSEVYKDLLAITSTSTMIPLSLRFEKPPTVKLEEFLTLTLKFLLLSKNDNNIVDDIIECSRFTEKMEVDYDESRLTHVNIKESFFFYCEDNYFKGVLIRLKHIDEFKASLKVYIRLNHQLVTLIKAISGKYCERCTVQITESNENSQNDDNEKYARYD